MNRWQSWAIGAAIGVLFGLLFGWQLWHHAPVVEGEAIERKLPGGAVVVERDPKALAPAPIVQAAKETGGKVTRFIHATIQPLPPAPPAVPVQAPPPAASRETPPPGSSVAAAAALVCPPVDVDLALVEKGDGSLRAVLTSSGKIIEAKDIPVSGATVRAQTHWAAGGLYGPAGYGGLVTRAFGPFEVGAAAIKDKQSGWGAYAVVQVKW